MKTAAYHVFMSSLVVGLAVLFVTIHAAPMEGDDEQAENTMIGRPDHDMEMPSGWDPINTAALRKFLMELDAEERMGRATRSWPQAEPRGWERSLDGRLARQWRTDKRQVRFRQCYFNPISCFRK
uniref:C type allatostatin n=1 Tax=Clostera anastomosis TaxID=300245 RepID=J7EQE8_9NEOP|nr:C type allatostatin [Clostera anastomosis]AEM44669.1 C type allatostatin [Clostera anastomosis]